MSNWTVEVDADELIQALDALGSAAQPYLNAAAKESAGAIAREARGRLARQLGPASTGQTLRGIEARPALDGNGYVVSASNDRMPNLPWWLEKGTRKGKPGSHTAAPRPYFDVAVALEQGAHLRRIDDALQQAIDDRGLNDG